MKKPIFIILIIVSFLLLNSSIFIVPEGRQAIVTEFGKPVGDPITNAGLHFKKPFIQDTRYVDKRILSWDGFPNQIPTKDKKYIKVDTTARWRIVDALKFIQTVQNERGAKARLDTILDGHTRDIISGHNLVEAVRNSNAILDRIKEQKNEIQKKKEKGEFILEDEMSNDIETISEGREKLSAMIVEKASKELLELGIELIAVQLKRISYESSVESKVYERMISERKRIAQKIRSIGKGEKAKIEGRLSRDLRKIESEAYKKAQQVKGEAQARSTAIYAKAFGRDPGFYEFIRTMQAYEKSLKSRGKFILSSDSKFLKYLK